VRHRIWVEFVRTKVYSYAFVCASEFRAVVSGVLAKRKQRSVVKIHSIAGRGAPVVWLVACLMAVVDGPARWTLGPGGEIAVYDCLALTATTTFSTSEDYLFRAT